MPHTEHHETPNFLIIMSDEHDPAVTGCYGHPTVRTPYLDRLASEGTVFDSAYSNCPLCVPARMAFLTGLYVHRNKAWDNASELRLEIPTFANYMEAAGYDTVLCGRMHMVGTDRSHGFCRRLYEDITQHTHPGKGPARAPEGRRGSASHVTDSGPGQALFEEYDSTVADLSARFLEGKALEVGGRPWVLVSGFMYPHFPLVAPRELYDLYYPDGVIMPDNRGETFSSQHPVIQHLRYHLRVDEELPEDLVRRALASYYGLITLTDRNIGRLLEVIDHSTLRDNTVVIYTSDHGENGGHHGLWQKHCFYEASVRVPLIMRDPRDRRARRVSAPVSLVDIMPTIMERARIGPANVSGRSFLGLARGAEEPGRIAFSEFHANGMLGAGYMLRKGRFKYNHYVGHAPQLFELSADPGEFNDLAPDPAYRAVRDELEQELRSIVNPEEVDQEAKANQRLPAGERTTWFSWLDFSHLVGADQGVASGC